MTAATLITPGERYCYDGKKYDASSDTCVTDSTRAADYARGALTHSAARASGGSIVSETRYTGIDALGRVTSSVQTTAGLDSKSFTYRYAAGGALSAIQYPSGQWASYDLNGANRVTAVRRGQDAGTPFGSNYILSNGQYKPNGAVAGATLGMDPDSLNQWSETWDYNSRLQPRSVTVTKGTTLLGLQWIYSSSYNGSTFVETGQDNNGNVKFERLQYPNSGTTQTVLRTYGYDASNRLSTYSEPSKSQSFGYYAFGNLWQSGGNSGGVPDLLATSASSYLLSTVSVSNRLAGTAYDAAGNQTQLSTVNGTNATYDAENRLVKVDQSGATVVTYDYDGDGRRVKVDERRQCSGVVRVRGRRTLDG